jgi:hypothetical protein
MNLSNVKQHIKNHADMIIKENTKDRYQFNTVRRVDFDIEIEGLKFNIKNLSAKVNAYKEVCDALNFSLLVLAQVLEDKKLINEKLVNSAAKKIHKRMKDDMKKHEISEIISYQNALLNPNVKAVEA